MKSALQASSSDTLLWLQIGMNASAVWHASIMVWGGSRKLFASMLDMSDKGQGSYVESFLLHVADDYSLKACQLPVFDVIGIVHVSKHKYRTQATAWQTAAAADACHSLISTSSRGDGCQDVVLVSMLISI